MDKKPYVLAVASHKGGTGRTTAALALSWVWGRGGARVVLVDADPIGAAGLVALTGDGACPWDNVTYLRAPIDAGGGAASPSSSGFLKHLPAGTDVVVVDCPSLTEMAAQRVLRVADGIVLLCLAEPLTLRTIPTASAAIQLARESNPDLELLGIMIGIFNERDPLQVHMLGHVRHTHGELLLEPPVPHQQALSDWPLEPGSDLPYGPAQRVYATIARTLEQQRTVVMN